MEREELEELEGERQAHKEAIEAAAAEDPAIRRLDKRVSTMIDKLRHELEGAHPALPRPAPAPEPAPAPAPEPEPEPEPAPAPAPEPAPEP